MVQWTLRRNLIPEKSLQKNLKPFTLQFVRTSYRGGLLISALLVGAYWTLMHPLIAWHDFVQVYTYVHGSTMVVAFRKNRCCGDFHRVLRTSICSVISTALQERYATSRPKRNTSNEFFNHSIKLW